MRDFNQGRGRDSNRGGGRRFGGRDSRGRDRGDRPMHTATCDNCQKECQVPFKPTGDRPVYCSDCFSQQPRSESRGGERSYSSNYHKPSATPAVDYSHQFEKLHKKLDNLTELVLKLKDAQSPGKFTLPTGPDKFRADED